MCWPWRAVGGASRRGRRWGACRGTGGAEEWWRRSPWDARSRGTAAALKLCVFPWSTFARFLQEQERASRNRAAAACSSQISERGSRGTARHHRLERGSAACSSQISDGASAAVAGSRRAVATSAAVGGASAAVAGSLWGVGGGRWGVGGGVWAVGCGRWPVR
jgi:hypothetical protein